MSCEPSCKPSCETAPNAAPGCSEDRLAMSSTQPVIPMRSGQRGSVLVLVLLGLGLIAAAFLYVAVIGSRSSEKMRARTAADASAMAAATVKAKIMNYEAFILLADSVLLPLGQITENIGSAQALATTTLCVGSIFAPWLIKYCLQYAAHVLRTAPNISKVDKTVTGWLDGLEAMAQGLIEVGPVWAEGVAVAVGMSSAYREGKGGVSIATALPSAIGKKDCRDLGIEMIDNTVKVQGRDACHDLAYLQFIYLFAHFKPVPWAIDVLGMTLTGSMLSLGAQCDKSQQVPQLKSDWRRHSISHGMALVMKPSDREHLRHLEAIRGTEPPRTLFTGWMLGMGCAEHYSQEHRGKESLWEMDWRARLVPCNYEDSENVRQVTQCAGPYLPILTQFENEKRLGIAKDWKF